MLYAKVVDLPPVTDEAIMKARDEASIKEGMLMCPEGAATLAAYQQELRSGRISPDEDCVLFNCATGLKYPLPAMNARINLSQPIDFESL